MLNDAEYSLFAAVMIGEL